MKIAVASDEQTSLTRSVCELLKQQGHELCLMGALTTGEDCPWPLAAHQLAEAVAQKTVDEGILFCWTGTGAAETTGWTCLTAIGAGAEFEAAP